MFTQHWSSTLTDSTVILKISPKQWINTFQRTNLKKGKLGNCWNILLRHGILKINYFFNRNVLMLECRNLIKFSAWSSFSHQKLFWNPSSQIRPHSLVVTTLDFESKSPSSNLGGAFFLKLFFLFFFTKSLSCSLKWAILAYNLLEIQIYPAESFQQSSLLFCLLFFYFRLTQLLLIDRAYIWANSTGHTSKY